MACWATPINQHRVNRSFEMDGYANCSYAFAGGTRNIIIPYNSFWVAASINNNGGNNALEMKTYHIDGFKSGSNTPRQDTIINNTVEGGWHNNYDLPYKAEYGYYAIQKMSDSPRTLGGYTFQIRNNPRVYRGGTSLMATLSAGDAIMTDGNGTAGESYGDRLLIIAYRKNGVWYENYHAIEGLWVETGLRQGGDTGATMSVWSSMWGF